MTYNADVWLQAEHHYPAVSGAREQGRDVRMNVVGDLYLASSIWGDNRRRYTGIHTFNLYGMVKPLTGVNLDEMEWSMLVENFPKVKELLKGKSMNLGECKRSFDYEESIQMYMAKWFLGDKLFDNATTTLFYSEEEAAKAMANHKPVRGVDYLVDDETEPDLRIETVSRPPPDITMLMNLIMVNAVNQNILTLAKKYCEACQIDSDSQFDHCRLGNCLDETTNHVDLYHKEGKEMVQVNELMAVFDKVRQNTGARPIFSKQLAKCATIWISDEQIVQQISTICSDNFLGPLMDVIQKAYENRISQ